MSEERRERYALGHKKWKTYEKYEFLKRFARFLRAIHSNHKRITHITVFKEQIAHGRDFERKSERANSQPCNFTLKRKGHNKCWLHNCLVFD